METMNGTRHVSEAMQAEPLALAAWGVLEERLLSMGLEPVRVEHELACVLDTATRTGHRLTLTGPREYGVTKWHEVPGTIDAVVHVRHVETGEAFPIIIDWKFGMEPVEPDSAQMRTLGAAYMLSTVIQPAELWVGIVQSNETGTSVKLRTYAREDLVAHVEMLGDALNEVHEGRMMLQRGPECRYCRAANACPSQLPPTWREGAWPPFAEPFEGLPFPTEPTMPFRLRLGGVDLVVLDSSDAGDTEIYAPQHYAAIFRRVAAMLADALDRIEPLVPEEYAQLAADGRAVSEKIVQWWTPPQGTTEFLDAIIEVRVAADTDGTVLAVRAVDQTRIARDARFKLWEIGRAHV